MDKGVLFTKKHRSHCVVSYIMFPSTKLQYIALVNRPLRSAIK